MKIHILSCFHGRPQITEIFCIGMKRLQSIDFFQSYTFVVSDEENKKVLDKHGFKCVFYNNLPVSNKFNFGLKESLKKDYDYLCIMGSDDLLSNEGAKLLKAQAEKGTNYFGFNKVSFYNTVTKEQGESCTGEKLVGCGRMISRKAIEQTINRAIIKPRKKRTAMNWQIDHFTNINTSLSAAKYLENIGHFTIVSKLQNGLWDAGLNKSLDHSSEVNLAIAGFYPVIIETEKVHLLDVKSEENITHIAMIKLEESNNLFWFLSLAEKNAISML